MSTVEKKVRLIRWRLEWLNFARRFVRLFLIALIILTLCLIALKFISLPWQFAVIARWLVAATVPLALLWAALTRTSLSGAAVTADQRLALRERLSTALAVGAPQTAMEQALMADAQTHASRLMAHRAFPMPLWRDLCFMPIPLIAMALVGLLVPRYDLFG
ncbi:hypothetical protein FJY63_12470, partial [Candidatus Sumerlaeota bacterium]|nr:hypothetical protein [Candidatus Sumerlaeota bacterium]